MEFSVLFISVLLGFVRASVVPFATQDVTITFGDNYYKTYFMEYITDDSEATSVGNAVRSRTHWNDKPRPSKFKAFALKHIMDPSLFKNSSSITVGELNSIMETRAESLGHGYDLRRKESHIYIIGSPNDVRDSFQDGPASTIFDIGIPFPFTMVGISNRPFNVIGLHKTTFNINEKYDAWDCGPKFIVSGLSRTNDPLYLNGMQDTESLPFPFPTVPTLNILNCKRLS